MNITKFGHSCLLVEENNTRILIDPGTWSEGHTELENLDAIFITHEHQDHCDIPSLQILMQKNFGLKIYTNDHVGKKLEEAGILYELFEDGRKEILPAGRQGVKGIEVEAFGRDHAVIYQSSPCHNVGYLFGNRLFHPGDSFTVPSKPVEILALPVCGSWMKLSECIDYAKVVKPKIVFPIHEAMLKEPGNYHSRPMSLLTPDGIDFKVLELGQEYTF